MYDKQICQECYTDAPLHHELNLCEDCYNELFEPKPDLKDDFTIKHETAVISNSSPDSNITYAKLHNGSLVKIEDGGIVYNPPKRYVFNSDSRVKDFEKLIVFLLNNMRVYDDSIGFDKVKYMFKEYEGGK